MPATLFLANSTKKEVVLFSRIAASKGAEIAGHPAAAAVVAWYMASNLGDSISFVSEYDTESPFKHVTLEQLCRWPDVTDTTVDQLIAEGILEDRGKIIYSEDDQDVWDRDLVNIWWADA